MADVNTLNLDLRHLLKTHSAGYLVYTLGWSVIHIKSRHIQHSFDPVGLKKKKNNKNDNDRSTSKIALYMLQLPREGRVIDEVKVRLGTIHDISLGGGGQWGGFFFWGGGYLAFRGKGRESVVANRVIM